MCVRGWKGFTGNFIEVQSTGRKWKESCVICTVVGKKSPAIRNMASVHTLLGGRREACGHRRSHTSVAFMQRKRCEFRRRRKGGGYTLRTSAALCEFECTRPRKSCSWKAPCFPVSRPYVKLGFRGSAISLWHSSELKHLYSLVEKLNKRDQVASGTMVPKQFLYKSGMDVDEFGWLLQPCLQQAWIILLQKPFCFPMYVDFKTKYCVCETGFNWKITSCLFLNPLLCAGIA